MGLDWDSIRIPTTGYLPHKWKQGLSRPALFRYEKTGEKFAGSLEIKWKSRRSGHMVAEVYGKSPM